jgi:hypothetical protein
MKNLFIISLLFFISCSEIDTLKSSFDESKVTLSLQNINDPAADMYYEAWIRQSGGINASLGLLEKNQDGFGLQTTITHEQNFRGRLVFITIERDNVPGMRFTQAGDTLFTPSSDVVTCSVINGNQGYFSVANGFITNPGDANSLNTEFDLENATASITVFTPTQNGDNERSGIWFTNLTIEDGDTTATNSLHLPAYGNGWLYEAFLSISGQQVSLGKFANPSLPDAVNPYSGPQRNRFTAFPGEDFINNPPAGLSFPLDLSNGVVSVKLTPVYSDGAINMPFSTVLFEGTIPSGYNAGDVIDLNPVLTTLPSGSLTIELDLYN